MLGSCRGSLYSRLEDCIQMVEEKIYSCENGSQRPADCSIGTGQNVSITYRVETTSCSGRCRLAICSLADINISFPSEDESHALQLGNK